MLRQCPMRADFSQEAWVLRCVGWEESGPHLPAWIETARAVVAGVRNQVRKENEKHANVAAGGR